MSDSRAPRNVVVPPFTIHEKRVNSLGHSATRTLDNTSHNKGVRFYCAKVRDGHCPANLCGGRCGPMEGCNCTSCAKLDLLYPSIQKMNSKGYLATKRYGTGHQATKLHYYCGRGKRNVGICPDAHGNNCSRCRQLDIQDGMIHNLKAFPPERVNCDDRPAKIVQILEQGHAGFEIGQFRYYCGKLRQSPCPFGICNKFCGPLNGCCCAACAKLIETPVIKQAFGFRDFFQQMALGPSLKPESSAGDHVVATTNTTTTAAVEDERPGSVTRSVTMKSLGLHERKQFGAEIYMRKVPNRTGRAKTDEGPVSPPPARMESNDNQETTNGNDRPKLAYTQSYNKLHRHTMSEIDVGALRASQQAAPASAPASAPAVVREKPKQDIYLTLGHGARTNLVSQYHKDIVYDESLEMIKELITKNQTPHEMFISYAWPTESNVTRHLQSRLKRLKRDLVKTGATVWLDIDNMVGQTEVYMKTKIESSTRVLVICTPRLKERAEDTVPNNLIFEMDCILEKCKLDPCAAVPLIFEGDRGTSVPNALKSFLSIDFTKTDEHAYQHSMAAPNQGLLSQLYNLSESKVYQLMVSRLHGESQNCVFP